LRSTELTSESCREKDRIENSTFEMLRFFDSMFAACGKRLSIFRTTTLTRTRCERSALLRLEEPPGGNRRLNPTIIPLVWRDAGAAQAMSSYPDCMRSRGTSRTRRFIQVRMRARECLGVYRRDRVPFADRRTSRS